MVAVDDDFHELSHLHKPLVRHPGLDPGTQQTFSKNKTRLGGRVKPGHDDRGVRVGPRSPAVY